MVFQRSCLRYAHTSGHTSLIYTKDGESIITCGSDGDIRKWKGIDDDDPTSTCLGEFVICIADIGDKLLASTDLNTLQSYTYPDIEKAGTLLRFTAPVTCVCIRDIYTVAGSEDCFIKYIKNGDISTETQLEGHEGPLLALDVSAKGLLASIAGDGLLKIWDLNSGTEVKTINGLIKTNSFERAECLGTPVFEPENGNSLAYVQKKEIYVLNTNNWELQFKLTDERNKGNYSCCQFSKDGQFIAAGTTEGEINIFDYTRKQSIKCETPSSECQAITCIAWDTKNNLELAYCDASGQLGTLFSSGVTISDVANDAEADEVDFEDIDFERNNDDVVAGSDNGFNDNYDDDEDVDGVSIEKLKRQVMKSSETYINGGLTGDEDTKDSLAKSVHNADVDDYDDDKHNYVVKTYKQQEAFQPSSTPSHLEHRYLAWNNVGIVTAHSDGADGSIDVEFHDTNIHHSLHITNYSQHNMASLSSTVLSLSAEGSSKLVCIALAASGNKEWSVTLPDCESIEALIATTKIVGVATNNHYLRLFTVMGTQREIISIPGPVLALAGYKERIIVCYHSAPAGEHKQQHISAMLIQTNGLSLRTQHLPIPLPADRKMTWLGFTDCGSPVFTDSMGLLQLFSLKSNCWYPICDSMKQSQSVSNNYFIIDVSERSQIVQAVLCRGTSYPMTNPRPMMQELNMRLPLCDMDSEKSELEDALIRASFMNVDGTDKIIKENAIKLFALACRTEIEARAKELIETIACPDMLLLAVKYATKLGRIHLSDKLCELMPQVEEQKNQREKDVANENIPESPLAQLNAENFVAKSSNTPTSTTNLAPKSMELSLVKRVSLKRFVGSNTPTGLKKFSFGPHSTATTPTNTQNSTTSDLDMEMQENAEVSYSESKLSSSDKDLTRTPLNSVNPFAAKRKISDVDGNQKGFVFGSDKLKMIKK
ncbi:WD repeat and HMG-box DNA-binding protein 1-like [Teleopsis dalmanni]|uniref:WD repeat and HMG-box DNA-binding protein 1-like n=1 Tax=Teleopsis dalmanni TaxID=139649 RepID=UPI0018CEEA55|nr:WD repeat and HMG-box DNA-binding protein 1-like [Teleopsis dalmanni]